MARNPRPAGTKRSKRRALAVAQPGPIVLADAFEAARDYASASRSAATWRAYRSDWKDFEAWCRHVERAALPATPETVALYLAAAAKAKRAPSTLARRLSAIRLVHLGARLPSPHDALEVSEVMAGIRRRWSRPPAQNAPAMDADVQRMADAAADSLRGLRDRALILLGFAGAFRRSELVALNVEDLTEREAGLDVRIARSKTDQDGAGVTIGVLQVPDSPNCPVTAIRTWLAAAAIERGPVFRRVQRNERVGERRLTGQSVALIVKKLAAAAGLDAARYSGHSLRSGFLTSAARAHASIFKMAEQSRHKSLNVLRGYVRDRDRFDNHAADGLLQSLPARRPERPHHSPPRA